ncbi:TIGR03943 family putative permease subunit [Peribacillus frigoritolerans]|uniref:TIGR03943 family putative permease subunit n=1 Tax=Peribacillus frigoritolerans TaxID=450367 RepID=UPI001F4F3DE3|nr:TIGR03943 family protein [Peribacillus frigoritolerans]MCK2017183.1 TIGR03943 family protein [Peribacillus frigoritolerans]
MKRFFIQRLEGLLLLGLGLMIFKLYVSGYLTKLIAPKMVPYALAALFAFLVSSLLRMKKQKQSEQHCDCGSNGESSVLKYGLFFLPILLGFILTDFTLSGEVLAKRGMAKQQAQMVSSYDSGKHANGEKISVTDDNYFEVLDDLLNNLDTIEGKEIEISGFIYREDTFTKKQMAISRLSMSCCVVDATLYGYMVNGNVEGMKTNDWYTITGTLKKGSYKGEPVPVIDLKESKKIKAPEEAYLYENVQIIQ